MNISSIDFNDLSNSFNSIVLPIYKIKPPSKLLPTENVICKKDAFRVGAKEGSGSAVFYKLIPKIKEIFRKLPSSKTGRLVDEINLTRNEARKTHADIKILTTQFDHMIRNSEIRGHDVLMTLYLLERSHNSLKATLETLRMLNGLLKGNAKIGANGFIVAGKEPLEAMHPYLLMRAREKEAEIKLLEEFTNRGVDFLRTALLRLSEIGLNSYDFEIWKTLNKNQIETSLNTFRGAGFITGVAIQGSMIVIINFGIAGATLNPAVFAAGAYYTVSTVLRIGEIVVKTKLQNKLIREASPQLENIECSPINRNFSAIRIVENIEEIHGIVDGLANTGLGTAALVFALPISTGKPATISKAQIMRV